MVLDESPTPTRIARVTVYRNGALVVRAGSAPPGPVTVHGLPLLFSSDSLRVRPRGARVDALRELAALSGATAAPTSLRDARLAELRATLERVERDRQRVERLIAATQRLLGPPPTEDPITAPEPARLLALAEAADQRLEALDAQLIALRRRREEVERALTEAVRDTGPELDPPRFTRGLGFDLVAETPGDAAHIEFEVEYFVHSARWVPTYRLDLDGDVARVRLDAWVAQATGEDWRGAELRLATADLARSATLPSLSSWRVGPRRASPPKAYRPLPPGLSELFADYFAAHDALPVPPTGIRSAPPTTTTAVTSNTAITSVNAITGPLPGVSRDSGGTQPSFAPQPAERRSGAVSNEQAFPPSAPPPSPGAPSQDPWGQSQLASPTQPWPEVDDEVDWAGAPPPAPASFGAPAPGLAPPAPMMAGASAKMSARSRGGGGPEAAPQQTAIEGARPPDDGLPTRWRYPYLRLRGPYEDGRGTLWPLDETMHLWSLVADAPGADFTALQRAVRALLDARGRLKRAPLPPGTEPPDGAFHHVFPAGETAPIPADGGWHRVHVTTLRGQAESEYRAVPRAAPEIYRFALVTVTDPVPLPTGPLSVHVDGRFRVQSTLSGVGGLATLNLNLGVEPALRVLDRVARLEQTDRGLIGQRTRADHHITLRVRSALSEPATLVVYDRHPVYDGVDDAVAVTLLPGDPTPEETARDPNEAHLDGGLRWRLPLAPGQVATLTWGYRVELPAKQELRGGNRRE